MRLRVLLAGRPGAYATSGSTDSRLVSPHDVGLVQHFRLRIQSSLLLEVLFLIQEHVLGASVRVRRHRACFKLAVGQHAVLISAKVALGGRLSRGVVANRQRERTDPLDEIFSVPMLFKQFLSVYGRLQLLQFF